MATGNFRGLVLRFAVVSGIAVSLMQCSQPQVAPHFSSNTFQCTGSRNVQIKTQVDTPGVSPEIAVLCQNDTLTWNTDPGRQAAHFTVTFKSGTPLKGSDGKDKLTFSDKSNDSSGKAGDAGLQQAGTYGYYPYSIDVVDDTNKTHHYDPGVIIVK